MTKVITSTVSLVKLGLKLAMKVDQELKDSAKVWSWKSDEDKWRKLSKSVEIYERDDAYDQAEVVDRLVTAAVYLIKNDNKMNLCNSLQKARAKKIETFKLTKNLTVSEYFLLKGFMVDPLEEFINSYDFGEEY